MQVAEALEMIAEEGLPRVFERHERMAARVREGAAALGLAPQCPALSHLASTVTALALPEAHPPRAVRDGLKARGILTAAGLGRFEPRGFRIGHLGDIRPADVERTLSALAEVLGP
jgi:alanine-glyoxylate transaminase/serine-glyoxylate transaminase/serine-pyruvate transaminase